MSCLTSADGVTWDIRSAGTVTPSFILGVSYGNGNFVAVGLGFLMTSPDGITWTFSNAGTREFFSAVTFGNETFVVVGSNGTIIQSDPVK